MTTDIYWLLELAIKDGHLADFETLMNEMSQATQQNEPNTLNYEWWVSDDKSACHIYERYTDSDAVMTHLMNFGANFAERFLSHVEPTRFVVYGNVNEDVKAGLKDLGPIYMDAFGGYSR